MPAHKKPLDGATASSTSDRAAITAAEPVMLAPMDALDRLQRIFEAGGIDSERDESQLVFCASCGVFDALARL